MPDYNEILVHHDLKVIRPQRIRLLIAQFTTNYEDWEQKDGLCFLKNPDSVWSNIDKLLTVARQYTVDMVILPELSVPSQCISEIQSWSREIGATVIAGSHYHKTNDKYISRCPIIVAGEVFFTEKITPAPSEKSPFEGEGIVSGNKIALIRNSPVGNFGVLICSDYLNSDIRRILIKNNIDILCVPACQNKSELYYSRMNIDCEESENGIYILYSNMLYDEFGDGRSALFGKMDNYWLEQIRAKGLTDINPPHKIFEMKSNQNFVVIEVDLDHKRPYINRTVNSDPNVFFIKTEVATDNLTTQFSKSIAHSDERYKKIVDFFVPPVEYEAILNKLEKHKFVFIVGDPGIGKTYTAARILRHYFDTGYKPIWYTGLEKEERIIQRQILENFEPRNNEVIYFEDPFGRTAFEKRDAIYQIFGPLVDRLVNVDARIIVTSRREIFERFTQESLSSKDYEKFKEEMSVIKPSYDSSALIKIMKCLASNKCKWLLNNNCVLEVEKAIRNKYLPTPFAIRNFVFATENVTSLEILNEMIYRRKHETAVTFAIEFQSCTASTKLSLILIYLFGFKEQHLLVRWFNLIAIKLGLVEGGAGSVTFMQEIRLQMGYRVEQFGNNRRGLRFTHPIYEEAFTEIAQNDQETEKLLLAAIEVVSKNNFDITLNSISRNHVKYPQMTANLFKKLAEYCDEDFDKTIKIGSQLVALYMRTKQVAFRNLIEDLCSYQEIVQYINKRNKIGPINEALRFAFNYRLIIKNQKNLMTSEIDWSRLFYKMNHNKNFYVTSTLEWAKLINPNVVNEYINTISFSTLCSRCVTLVPEERKRLLNLLKGTDIYDQFSDFLKLNGTRYTWYSHREFLIELAKPNAALIIDNGAVKAIQNRMNLLPSGIVNVIGSFNQGDIINIIDNNNQNIGAGVIEYDSEDVRNIRGHHSNQILEITGRFFGWAVMRSASMFVIH
jgi:predicted amidohydrolase